MASKMRALVNEARWRGFWGTIRAVKLNKMGTMHCFVGEDQFRNRFFEDMTESYGRDRWVEYGDHWNFDSLKITPEWHAWLHHNIDAPPTKQPLPEPTYKVPATGNPTGTRDAYVPPHHRLSKKYDGLPSEKYESWNPSQSKRQQRNDQNPSTKHAEADVLDLK